MGRRFRKNREFFLREFVYLDNYADGTINVLRATIPARVQSSISQRRKVVLTRDLNHFNPIEEHNKVNVNTIKIHNRKCQSIY